MRLKRLDLTRYGKFTDHRLDFGERVADEPDLHIVYGPNEAGKSTAFAAFLDLLFGIEPRSRFNFLHPYAAMRIGGSLELAGGTRELVRVKRPQGSLLDAAGQPVAETLIQAELGGIDRDSYRTMFSLDDETLEAGGESILASKGDLGQLLFSASAGLAELNRQLAALRGEADEYYRFRARSGVLGDLKARLAGLREERERIDTLASHYAQRVETRDRLATQYEEALAERGRLQSRMEEIGRLLNALPRLHALRGLRESLAPLAALPEAPPGWAGELPRLEKDETELATRMRDLDAESGRHDAESAGIVVDVAALAVAGRVEDLAALRARHVTAEKDLPERRLQLREAELEIAGILRRIGRAGEPDPGRLLPGAAIEGALRQLIETRSGIEAAATHAQAALAEARRRLDEALARFGEAGGDPERRRRHDPRMLPLRTVVTALRNDDHAARLRLADRSHATQSDLLAVRMAELLPWRGEIRDLAAMAVPDSALIERWKTAQAEAQARLLEQENETDRLAAEILRLRAGLEAAAGDGGIVGDQEAGEIRTRREQAWADHRRRLDAASAGAFEAALRQDDIATGARLAQTSLRAELLQAKQRLAMAEADSRQAHSRLEAGRDALARLREETAGFIRGMAPGLSADMPLPQLESWLARRVRALEAWTALRQAERDRDEAEADAANARTRLAEALAAAFVPHEGEPHDRGAGFAALLDTAQAAIDREAALTPLWDAVEERRGELKDRESAAGEAEAAARAWEESWASACGACWLRDEGSIPRPGAVRQILAALADLVPALEKRAGLGDRIAKMEHDQAAFAAAIAALAGELALPVAALPVPELARLIDERIGTAKAALADRTRTEQALATLREKRDMLSMRLADHTKRVAAMADFLGAGTLAEVGAMLARIGKRAELREQAAQAERDIRGALPGMTAGEAEFALDSADRAALEAEHARLKIQFANQDRHLHALFAAHQQAAGQVEAIGGDDAVARIEAQRRTTLLEIEEKALRYLRLRAGTAAAEQALRLYRDRHRSSMMAQASQSFRTISRGAYQGLATQPDRESEILIAVGADGGSKMASELSKGTRFQLYLALRVAGYREFARAARPVPFIADDIMETFDDFRAEEAFRLFGDMARTGQVIYLTHHRHLCAIAQRACPGARTHQLAFDPPRSAPADR